MATQQNCRRVILLLLLMVTTAEGSGGGVTASSVSPVLDSISRLLDFFSTNYVNAGVDSVFGLRVIEGQCRLLVDEYEKGELEFVAPDLMRRVAAAGVRATKLANMALPHVHESEREHFVTLKGLVGAPWKFFHRHRIVNPSLRWDEAMPTTASGFNREDSDRCLGELQGGSSGGRCRLSERCLVLMFARGRTGFHLQRQIFYSIAAQKFGCEPDVNAFLVSRTRFASVEAAQHELCTNAFYELLDEELAAGTSPDGGDIAEDFRHLFLEMEFNCPSVGFFQFMRRAWLDTILSWQTPDGCFGLPRLPVATKPPSNSQSRFGSVAERRWHGPAPENSDDRIRAYLDSAGPQMLHVASGPPRLQVGLAPSRRQNVDIVVLPKHFMGGSRQASASVAIRRLQSLDPAAVGRGVTNDGRFPGAGSGCSAQLTTAAFGSLAMYLRYLIDPGPPEFMHLRLESYLNRGGGRVNGTVRRRKKNKTPATTRKTTWAFLGTYQRRWDPHRQSIYASADSPPPPFPQADMVNRAEVLKELPDWTVGSRPSVSTSTTTTTTIVGRQVTVPVGNVSDVGDPLRSLRVHIIEIRPMWHRDLDNYLLAVTVISVVCLFLLLRYFRQRRHSRVKARLV